MTQLCASHGEIESIICLIMGQPWPLLSFIFGLFKRTSLQVLQKIYVKKCPSSIQCRDSNPQPSERESPPITTRPGLPFGYCTIPKTVAEFFSVFWGSKIWFTTPPTSWSSWRSLPESRPRRRWKSFWRTKKSVHRRKWRLGRSRIRSNVDLSRLRDQYYKTD